MMRTRTPALRAESSSTSRVPTRSIGTSCTGIQPSNASESAVRSRGARLITSAQSCAPWGGRASCALHPARLARPSRARSAGPGKLHELARALLDLARRAGWSAAMAAHRTAAGRWGCTAAAGRPPPARS
eukprot:7376305-Prymnesium_polylepis.1